MHGSLFDDASPLPRRALFPGVERVLPAVMEQYGSVLEEGFSPAETTKILTEMTKEQDNATENHTVPLYV